MTIGALVGGGSLLLFGIITWYLVMTLKQAQRTAHALEQLLLNTQPKLESAMGSLDSLLSRGDRWMAAVETGESGVANAFRIVGQAVAGWKAGSAQSSSPIGKFVSLASGVAHIVSRTWSNVVGTESPDGTASTGGRDE